MMPNLFIIGAAKAGTTALYDYLAQHPRVFLSLDGTNNASERGIRRSVHQK
jgi:hypothetical protein